MDFEKAYQKFLEGTATPEEMEFVRSEMKKANEINNVLATVNNEGVTDIAEKETVKKAMRRYWKKDTLKIVAIVCSALLVLAIGVACAIGIPIVSNAKKNTHYTEEQAKEIAIEYVMGLSTTPGESEIVVYKVEKELEVEGRIKNARYIYVVDVYNGVNNVLEIEIDSKTGKIIEVD